MAPRTRPDVRAYMVGRIKKLVTEANIRGMDGIATLLTTTSEAIDKGGPDLLEFAVQSRLTWQSIQARGVQGPVTPPGIVRGNFQRPGEPE